MTVRILVVEDNRDLAENIRELFEDTGAEVALCQHADEVRRHLETATFDLAIVDVRLPNNVSGIDLVPFLRKAAPDGEVILATGNASLGTAIEAVRHGVFAYLQKPFNAHDLLTLGERALAQVALRRERAALAAELSRSEALHRAVVETVDSLILGLDASHRVRMWNRCAAETTGWSADEVMGEDACAFLLEPEERGAFDRAVRNAMSGRGSDVMVRILTKRGDKRIVRWRITPLTPEGTALPLVLAAGTDVTEKLELEARAAEAEALGAMGRLTAGLAHEVRNPLNAAKLQLEIISRTARRLEASDARATIHARVDIVNAELRRLSRLLDEFLGLARPQHLAMGPVDLGAVVREVVELQAPVAENAGVVLEATVEVDRPAHGDAAKLKQALMNLIVNSLEAIGDAGSGRVEVRASRYGDDMVELSVADTGPGLPQPPKQLLQPFVTTKAAGTGLGLTIVNRIVELHGGTMEIGPRPEGGTVVRMHLPLAKA
jgi:PAS domain S-box-containing protein